MATCTPSQCGYDGACFDGGCARVHPGVTCSPPQLIAGGMIGPATPPAACQKSLRPTALPSAQVIPLGTHPVGQVVSFTTPANLASFSIVSQEVSAISSINYKGFPLDNSVVPDKVFAPDGTQWFDDFVFPDDLETAFFEYSGSSPVVNFMTIPNTERSLNIANGVGLPAGTWNFKVNDYAYECLSIDGCDGGTDSGVYELSVLLKPGPASTTATIDLGIYLVETSGLNSTTATTNAGVSRFVQSMTTLFAQQGICPGKITFYDVPQWATTRYANNINADESGPCSLLSQMFTLSQTDTNLNLFFVSAILGGSGGGTVLGIDGTIPGPSTIGGTVNSGAAVSTADLSAGSCGNQISPQTCGADQIAYIAAHEAGHWLGMFHTSEGTGTLFDPLGDTAKCECRLCVPASQAAACGNDNAPTFITGNTCNKGTVICGGSDNLMFWLLGGSTGGKLTADQGDVMRRNLVMH